MRIDKDQYYLNIAEAVAMRSTCLHHMYGAVLVNNDEIIATGYNGAPRGEANCCDRGYCFRDTCSTPVSKASATHGAKYGSCVAVHAEQNAIISAPRSLMQGATLYLVGLTYVGADVYEYHDATPCNICDRMIRNAGIKRIVTRAGEF